MRLRKTLVGATAAMTLAGCTGSHEQLSPSKEAPLSPSTTLTLGRNATHSALSFDGREPMYLIAINCAAEPKATYQAPLSKTTAPQEVWQGLTIGDTNQTEIRPHVTTVHEATIPMVAGLIFRSVGGGAYEFNRSDDQPGSTTTLLGGSDTEYIPIPGQAYTLVVDLDTRRGEVGQASVSCKRDNTPNPFSTSTPVASNSSDF